VYLFVSTTCNLWSVSCIPSVKHGCTCSHIGPLDSQRLQQRVIIYVRKAPAFLFAPTAQKSGLSPRDPSCKLISAKPTRSKGYAVRYNTGVHLSCIVHGLSVDSWAFATSRRFIQCRVCGSINELSINRQADKTLCKAPNDRVNPAALIGELEASYAYSDVQAPTR
jgi:hypothetical protein